MLKHLPSLLDALSIDSVKHLKDLIPLLSTILADPLGPGYPSLLLQASRATQAVIANGWPRMAQWKGEISKGVSVCWIRLSEEGKDMDAKVVGDIKEELKIAMEMLAEVVKTSEGEQTWREDVQKLVAVDERLEALCP